MLRPNSNRTDSRIRLMIADDHETVRQGLRALFASVAEVDVVEEVGDTDSALARVQAVPLDVVVLDLSIPSGGGLVAIRAIKAVRPDIAIVILTRYRDRSFVREALNAGASGYVLKQSSFNDVRSAVMRAVRGQQYVDPRLADTVEDAEFIGDEGAVTNREREVLRRTALGESNKDIAAALAISVRTVEAHKAHGMRKLGIVDRAALVRYATLNGWLSEP